MEIFGLLLWILVIFQDEISSRAQIEFTTHPPTAFIHSQQKKLVTFTSSIIPMFYVLSFSSMFYVLSITPMFYVLCQFSKPFQHEQQQLWSHTLALSSIVWTVLSLMRGAEQTSPHWTILTDSQTLRLSQWHHSPEVPTCIIKVISKHNDLKNTGSS